MCQYSADDGVPNDWHLVHLGQFATGGAGLVIVEASGVSPIGRISPKCLGLWNDHQTQAFKRITKFVKAQGAAIGIQLAHAGRKASTAVPWEGRAVLAPETGGWEPIAPSAIPFDQGWLTPKEMTKDDIKEVVGEFVAATLRAEEAGFDVIELHAAHGYLMHEFLSPLSNKRTDEYGGSFENRCRFVLDVTDKVRKTWPESKPLLVRVSATDWTDGGWDLEQTVALAKELKKLGVDLIDTSTGGNVAGAKIPLKPGYQVEFAAGVRKGAEIPTGAVGLISEPRHAEQILADGQADCVLLARELLRDPHWPLRAAKELGADVTWPKQYERAKQ